MRDRNIFKNFYENQAQRIGNKIVDNPLKTKLYVLIREITNNFPIGSRILDVGCQAGGLTVILSMLGFKVTGLDISSNYLKCVQYNANNNKVNPELYCGFAEDMDTLFKDRYFDVVVLSSMLEHTLNYMEIFEKSKQRLKKDGMILINVPLYKSWYSDEHLIVFDDENIKQFKECSVRKIYYKKNKADEMGWFYLKYKRNHDA